MTDDWTPENLPIMLLGRSLLTATKAKPTQIGTARITAQDENSIIAWDKEAGGPASETQLPSRYEAEADWLGELTDMPYQVSYYFPSSVRNNHVPQGKYGAPGMTNRVLYEALCDAFNGGKRFIEDYFLSVFPEHMKDRYATAVRALKQSIADEAQRRRQAHKMYLANFEVWTAPMTKNTFESLAKETKKDIVASLSTGKIPLQKSIVSNRTLELRRKLGIDSTQMFYATGRLISSIIVSVILVDKTTAAKEEGQ